MIDKNLAIGVFPQIMVRALVIMVVKDDMLDHIPSLLESMVLLYCPQMCCAAMTGPNIAIATAIGARPLR